MFFCAAQFLLIQYVQSVQGEYTFDCGLALDRSILGAFTAGWKVLLSFLQTALKWHYRLKDGEEEESCRTQAH